MRVKVVAAVAAILGLAGCATTPGPLQSASAPVEVKLIAFNDFHGNLEPPRLSINTSPADAEPVRVPAGGAAYLASAIASLRARNPNSVVISAGDMIGASPLVSALFLDEPTIAAMNLIKVDYNAVGNHEFDKGRAELLRMQKGGCEKFTARTPCAVEPFPGASFTYLAANTLTESGAPLFPAYGIRSFGKGKRQVKVGFIGMTLKETPTVVTPAGVAGLSFRDEAETANAVIPKLKALGADAIVILIHQGGATKVPYNDKSCAGLEGDLLPILDRLDPAVDLVVSGHTHKAYVCDYGQVNPARPFLLTSAGQYGTLVTDITLQIDPSANRLVAKSADNLIVQGEAYGSTPVNEAYPRYAADPAVTALVARYAAAAKPVAARVAGRLSGQALRAPNEAREQVLGNLVADAQLAATRSPETGGARIAFSNSGGVRADLVPGPDGSVTYGQLFAVQPFGNILTVKSLTGRQIRALLEQQWDGGPNTLASPNVLSVSKGLAYAYDLSRPAGERILDLKLDGAPILDDQVYRVTMNGFLASGGDNFTVFREGTDPLGGPLDVDALEAYIAAADTLAPPAQDRIVDRTPK
jgi:5'-nucleotidase